MDPLILTCVITSSVLVIVEAIKFLRKTKLQHFQSSCCNIKIDK
jgi:hypothetical protein